MSPENQLRRRAFLLASGASLGRIALAGLLQRDGLATVRPRERAPHRPPRAKRVIYLFQSGAPSQIELFDHKPRLRELEGQELPDSVRMGQRLTGMTANQGSFPLVPSIFPFRRRGASGAWVSDQLPHIGAIADRLCFVKSLHTEAINHDPAITFLQTGHQQPGRPSLGAWVSYGLGSENDDLPSFCVLLSRNTMPLAQPIYSRLWGTGFLPSNHQGVKLRASGDPVLFLRDPSAPSPGRQASLREAIARLDRASAERSLDPEVETRVRAYEMAHRMQTSVPELTDLRDEPASTFRLYGDDARVPGTHAAHCLLARRLVERGVRFVQLYHRGWDSHSNLPSEHREQCRQVDRGSAALVADLERRGLLEDTLVIWGGEFGRTVYGQGRVAGGNFGRDHHPRCFTVWLAGGGVRAGHTHGETDELGYNVVRDPVHVHDLNATILHLLGLDHERLTFRHQGRDHRLTDVHGRVVSALLA